MYYCSNCGASVSGAGRCSCCGVLLVGGGSGSGAGQAALRREYLKEHSVLYNIWLCIRRLLLVVFGIVGIGVFFGGLILVFYEPAFVSFEDNISRIGVAVFIIVIGWNMGKLLFRK